MDHSTFLCEEGNCIPPSWICDGIDDCFYAEDEHNCSMYNLKSHYAFNVNKLQETKSSLSLLMGSQQSHLHIDVLRIQIFWLFRKV